MGVKKVVEKIVELVEPKVVKTAEVTKVCPNCEDSGLQCHVCSVPFSDTFGE